MSENSKIEWTDHTFNHVRGCTKISDGCKNCYADTMSGRNPGVLGVWGKNGKRVVASENYWKEPLKWNLGGGIYVPRTDDVFRRSRVFCASLADVFEGDEEMPAADVPLVRAAQRRLFKLIHDTPNLDWLLLTKRPENVMKHIEMACREWACDGGYRETQEAVAYHDMLCPWRGGNPPHNVWLGTSVENQKAADERIPELLKIPAKVRFVSVEPMLGPVDFSRKWGLPCEHCGNADGEVGRCFCGLPTKCGIHWAIFGGESGPGARPCNVEWIRDGVRQCQAAGVSVFVKQLGAHVVDDEANAPWSCAKERCWPFPCTDGNRVLINDRKGGDMAEWPADLRVREFPV